MDNATNEAFKLQPESSATNQINQPSREKQVNPSQGLYAETPTDQQETKTSLRNITTDQLIDAASNDPDNPLNDEHRIRELLDQEVAEAVEDRRLTRAKEVVQKLQEPTTSETNQTESPTSAADKCVSPAKSYAIMAGLGGAVTALSAFSAKFVADAQFIPYSTQNEVTGMTVGAIAGGLLTAGFLAAAVKAARQSTPTENTNE